jgi:GNAT superfamily N-acetyltransferase
MLIWKVFFASRKRGISFEKHFPWAINERITTTLSFEDSQGKVIASLVIKTQPDVSVVKIAQIGLVCVDEAFRGQGLASALLNRADEVARSDGINALLLWTTKPRLYEKHGYRTDIQDAFAKVMRTQATVTTPTGPITQQAICDRGIPAFATSVLELKSRLASITVCSNTEQSTVIEFRGCIADVVNLATEVLPTSWLYNGPPDSKLPAVLRARGYALEQLVGAHRQVKILRPFSTEHLPYINVLDRI